VQPLLSVQLVPLVFARSPHKPVAMLQKGSRHWLDGVAVQLALLVHSARKAGEGYGTQVHKFSKQRYSCGTYCDAMLL
jgi:hypothetical protein